MWRCVPRARWSWRTRPATSLPSRDPRPGTCAGGAAGAVNLYCKFNDFNCDPLGEDPSTPTVRERSLGLLASANGDRDSIKPVHGRRFDKAARVYARQPGVQVYEANVWGEDPFGLTDGQFAVLQAVDGSTTWAELRDRLGAQQDVDECVTYLVTRGALDLAPPN